MAINPDSKVEPVATSEVLPVPDPPRVIYDNNPLIEVTCQMRFPPILRIVAEPPADFQESIRQEYPLFREKSPTLELPPDIGAGIAEVLRSAIPKQQKEVTYEFASEDNKWTVGLTKDFLAVSTKDYPNWQEFWSRTERPLNALLSVYQPAFFSRIGLRYQNLIRRKLLGLEKYHWSQLLKPHIAGMFDEPSVSNMVTGAYSQILIRFPGDSGQVRICHGLVEAADTQEECYLIDNDFFVDKKRETDNAFQILSYFNHQSGRLFRWCIEEKLHDAMGPQGTDTPR